MIEGSKHVGAFKCFSVKILDYYSITVHSLVCNKIFVLCYYVLDPTLQIIITIKL